MVLHGQGTNVLLSGQVVMHSGKSPLLQQSVCDLVRQIIWHRGHHIAKVAHPGVGRACSGRHRRIFTVPRIHNKIDHFLARNLLAVRFESNFPAPLKFVRRRSKFRLTHFRVPNLMDKKAIFFIAMVWIKQPIFRQNGQVTNFSKKK